MSMFCYQCQEAMGGRGCTKVGMCGKNSDLAYLQDVLIYVTKELSRLGNILDGEGVEVEDLDRFIVESLFMTITNANFDEERFNKKIREALKYEIDIKNELREKKLLKDDRPLFYLDDENNIVFKDENPKVGVLSEEDEDKRSLKELITYGLKGIAAYYEHAMNLGFYDVEIAKFIRFSLGETLRDDISVDDLITLSLTTGEWGVKVMALLDEANTSSFGHPEISEVNIGVRNNPAILISGHDLMDMKELLEQTEGTGVDVYTHSEMLPANYYPEFKKYSHFVGNYGNAWWQQKEEIEKFNGPILFTTNCIVPPKGTYSDRVYTTGSSGYPGFKHIADREDGKSKDFSEIIEHAKKLSSPREIEKGSIVGGFAHNQVFQLADKVVDLVKTGKIRKFLVMAGCDGRMSSRNYYTDFAKSLKDDTVILTAGCAKYKYNKLDLKDIEGVPRVLDAGQCNDSYSLVVIALKLQEIFELDDINDLPIEYNIAWYEQKAVIVLLALLSLGVKNIHLGPTLPAFLSENVVDVLVENFGISGISTVEEDIEKLG